VSRPTVHVECFRLAVLQLESELKLSPTMYMHILVLLPENFAMNARAAAFSLDFCVNQLQTPPLPTPYIVQLMNHFVHLFVIPWQ